MVVDEYHVGMHFVCESERLTLSGIELCQHYSSLRLQNLQPRWSTYGPVSHGFRRPGMLQLCQHGGWNQNLLVKLGEEIDLPDQNQVIYRRRVRDDNHVER